ncbi:hypothetical protein N7456_008116 [Penicillium angulare]|uniref:NACHT domain-containing protein n=1 Tax=Penicillium angulare TaxID=116970 RepID=A0A9W9K917_9EURO|nr:hypothetical protein N7456_008116 [Penicillium angulare]
MAPFKTLLPRLLRRDHRDRDQTSGKDQDRQNKSSNTPTRPESRSTYPFKTPDRHLSQNLWNLAYDSLQGGETDGLVKEYLECITVANADGNNPVVTGDMTDYDQRQECMRTLVERGQAKTARAVKASGRIGAFAENVLSMNEIVSPILSGVPQAAPAALPWAGVCIVLQILANPGKASQSNLQGMTSVVSRMEWYCNFADELLDKDEDPVFIPVMEQLKSKVVALYKAILSYQMESVCSYYRRQESVFFHALWNSTEWEEALGKVETAEKDLLADWNQVDHASAAKLRERLLKANEDVLHELGDIRQTLWDYTANQRRAEHNGIRRQILADLRITNPQDDMMRIKKENGEDITDDTWKWALENAGFKAITNWDENTSSPGSLLYIKGSAGSGKTMLLIAVLQFLSQQSAMLSPTLCFSFCQSSTRTDNMAAVLKCLMWMLLLQQPELLSHIEAEYNDGGPSPFSDNNASVALSRIFSNMISAAKPVLLVIDALDECDSGLNDLMIVIFTSLQRSRNVRWIVTSRPEIDFNEFLTYSFKPQGAGLAMRSNLIELDIQQNVHRLERYIQQKLTDLRSSRFVDYDENDLVTIENTVRQKADNNFLWVSLVFRDLKDQDPEYALDHIENYPKGLEKLYIYKFDRLRRRQKNGDEKMSHCFDILRAVSLLYALPIPVSELKTLLPQSKFNIQVAMQDCNSFLTLNANNINVSHKSAAAFLKSEDCNLHDLTTVGHRSLFESSSYQLSRTLKRDMYSLENKPDGPSVRFDDILPPIIDPLVLIRYSCVFWLDHLRDAMKNLRGQDSDFLCIQALDFLKSHFLHWVEGITLMKQISAVITSIKRLQVEITQSSKKIEQHSDDLSVQFYGFVQEAEQFIIHSRSMIEKAPLQIYGGALVFSPSGCLTKIHFWKERLKCIGDLSGLNDGSGLPKCWPQYRQAVSIDNELIRRVSFSADGKMLAARSSFGEGSVQLWAVDIFTATATLGQRLIQEKFQGPSLLHFSHSGHLLAASEAGGDTIYVWTTHSSTATATLKATLMDYGDSVESVAFSADEKSLISSHKNGDVRVWRIDSISAHSAHSAECKYVISPCGDRTDDYMLGLWSFDLSPTGTHFATHVPGEDIIIWRLNVKTGLYARWKSLPGDGKRLKTVAFSTDEQKIAVFWSRSCAFFALNPDNMFELSEQWECPSDQDIDEVTWTPDLSRIAFSYGWDQTIITILDVHKNSSFSENSLTATPGVGPTVLSLSPNGRILASGTPGGSVLFWDMRDLRSIGSRDKPFSSKTPNCVRFMPGTKQLVTCHERFCRIDESSSETDDDSFSTEAYTCEVDICLWNISSGEEFTTIELHKSLRVNEFPPLHDQNPVSGLLDPVLSPDGSLLAFTWKDTISVHFVDLLPTSQPFFIRSPEFVDIQSPLAFSPDGTLLGIPHPSRRAIELWHLDIENKTANPIQRLESPRTGQYYSEFCGLVFSPDSKTLAALTCARIFIWRRDDETEGFRLHRALHFPHDYLPSIPSFTPDGSFIILGPDVVSIEDITEDDVYQPFECGMEYRKDGSSAFSWICDRGKELLCVPQDSVSWISSYRNEVALIHHDNEISYLSFKLD